MRDRDRKDHDEVHQRNCHLSFRGLRMCPDLSRLVGDNLVRLDLSHNYIKQIDSFRSIENCLKLRELWLNDNPLESLDPSIGALKKLRFLDVSRTNLKKFPAELGSLECLNDLRVVDCHLLKENHRKITYLRVKCERRKLMVVTAEALVAKKFSSTPFETVLSLVKAVHKSMKERGFTMPEFKRLAYHVDRAFADDLIDNVPEKVIDRLANVASLVSMPATKVEERMRFPLKSSGYWIWKDPAPKSGLREPLDDSHLITFKDEIILADFPQIWMAMGGL